MMQLFRRTLRGILEHLYLTVVGAGVIAAVKRLVDQGFTFTTLDAGV